MEPNRNAANPQAVHSHAELEKRGRQQELTDLRSVLKTAEGRRFVWRIMGHCKVFGSIWNQSAMIHYLAGKQDVGHFLLSEVTAADEDSLFLMMKESRAEKELRQQVLESMNTQGESDV